MGSIYYCFETCQDGINILLLWDVPRWDQYIIALRRAKMGSIYYCFETCQDGINILLLWDVPRWDQYIIALRRAKMGSIYYCFETVLKNNDTTMQLHLRSEKPLVLLLFPRENLTYWTSFTSEGRNEWNTKRSSTTNTNGTNLPADITRPENWKPQSRPTC